MTEALAFERQLRWEIEGAERGITRYRESIEDADLGDTDPGKFMMREILTGLVAAIRATQEDVAKGYADPAINQKKPDWWLPMLCLEAEKMAFITARTAMNRGSSSGLTMTHIALAITGAVQKQREFDLWRARQSAASKGGAVDLYKVMVSRVKKIDARVARRWMKKTADFDRIEWPPEMRLRFGLRLAELLVAHSHGWFQVELVARRYQRRFVTERFLTLTEKGREFIAGRHAMSELTRPWLMPMLCPPNDWRPGDGDPTEVLDEVVGRPSCVQTVQ